MQETNCPPTPSSHSSLSHRPNDMQVDTHVHHSACMHQKHLLRFIKSKLRKEPDEVVIFRDGKFLTLREVFESLSLTGCAAPCIPACGLVSKLCGMPQASLMMCRRLSPGLLLQHNCASDGSPGASADLHRACCGIGFLALLNKEVETGLSAGTAA